MSAEVKSSSFIKSRRQTIDEFQPRKTGTVRYGDSIFHGLMFFFALLILVMTGLILWQLLAGSSASIMHSGLDFFMGTRWSVGDDVYGALPVIYGTLATSALALLIAVPLSLGAAIFLAELAPGWLRAPVSYLVELLAAIPSVVYGLWALFVMVPVLRDPVQTTLAHLGFLPFFNADIYKPIGLGIMAAGVILAIMILPIITALSRDVILVVPQSQREAYYALGATRWETIKDVVLPYARAGIIGAGVLGLGRALGETMAVAMVIGNSNAISASLFSPGSTMASRIANEFAEASDLQRSALIEIALVLFMITFLVNVAARLLIGRIAGKRAV